MNDTHPPIHDELLTYQTQRLQELIAEIIKCCEDRKLFESRKFGLPYAELRCLMLFNGERYLTVKVIASKLDVAKSRVTKLIEGLTRKGLIERIDDPRDARVKLLSLSPKGEEISRNIEIFQHEIHGQILLQLSPDERKQLIAQMEVLRYTMEAVKKQLV